jgi:hypothetical protein
MMAEKALVNQNINSYQKTIEKEEVRHKILHEREEIVEN